MKTWMCDYGEFEIPKDVPIHLLRKDGWFDRRRRSTEALRLYFEQMAQRLRLGMRIQSWREWR